MVGDAKRLQRTIQELLANQRDDVRLRDHLEGVRREPALPGLTWFWGPELYRRNRVVFREFILAHFSEFDSQGLWEPISYEPYDGLVEREYHVRGAARMLALQP